LLGNIFCSKRFGQHRPGVGFHFEVGAKTRVGLEQVEQTKNMARGCAKTIPELTLQRNMEVDSPLLVRRLICSGLTTQRQVQILKSFQ
jgi:hypothetical protein